MKNNIYLFTLFFFLSCNDIESLNNNKTVLNPNDSLIKTIEGIWGDKNGFRGLRISKDSIYYFNEQKSYYYLVHDNNMIVLYKEGPYMLGNIHVIKDTLFFTMDGSGDAEIKSFRVR